ncbi:RNA helicase [Swinepox virus]|uniref:RNA helicase NPH-II n=1 Tax=Swinepox virus TaxID=10276 RepID=A0A881SY59_SWPV|nr:RNA helicase [Swinepox virus]
MDNHLPNIFYFPNCINTFPYKYSQIEFDKMDKKEKMRFAYAVFPLIKHRWKYAYIIKDNNNVYKLNCESKQFHKEIILDNSLISPPTKIYIKTKEYLMDNIRISFECYSYIKIKQDTIDIHNMDDFLLRGLLEGGNNLNIFTNCVGHRDNTIGIFGNIKPFSKIPFVSLQPTIQQKIFSAWVSNNVVVLTGGTGVGKTSQVPKLLLWFNYLFGGFNNLNKIDFIVNEKPIVISLPRIALVKLHSNTILKSLGFDDIQGSPILLKFGNISDTLINKQFKNYGIVFSTHKLTLSKIFDYSTVIIDEVHEHDQIGDIIIAVVRKHLCLFTSLFMMTATLEDDRDRIHDFFIDPIFVHIPGPTRFKISEVFIKNSTNPKNKASYIEEEKKNIVHAIKRYTPPNKSSGILFVSSISQCESYKEYLSKYITYKIYIIHGKIKNIEDVLCSIYSNNDPVIIISTPYLESSITINNVTHIYDTGRVYIPLPYGGKEIFISKSMREQRKGRVGRVQPGIYIYFYNISYLYPIKRIDSEFLHNYVLYGKLFKLQLPDDLFIIPTYVSELQKVSEYIESFNIDDLTWRKLLSLYYINILEYAKIYAYNGNNAKILDTFERDDILNNDVVDIIKSLNMRAKIIKCKKYINNKYILTCKLMFGVYMGKLITVTYHRPLNGYIIMITDRYFIPDD